MRKLLLFIVLAAVVGVVGWKFFTTQVTKRESRRRRSSVVAVETAIIGQADLGDRATFTGSIYANERYDAAPKIPGIVKQVRFDAGDIIHKGDLIAVLDDDEYQLAVEQAEARVQVAEAVAQDAEAQLTITRREHERNTSLHSQRVISSQELDRIEATLTAQEAKLETTLAELKLSEAELKTRDVILGYTRVVADWDGPDQERVIGQRYRDPGNLVATTTPIVSVLDINSVKAVIPVSEKEFPRIRLNGVAEVVTDAFPGRVFHGRIKRIPQELGMLSREAEIEISIDNTDHTLKPGMFVRVSIEFQRHDHAVAAPLAAVVRRDDGSRGVYVVNDDRDQVVFQRVTEGIVDGSMVELINGGDLLNKEVVILGQHLLKDGMNVRIADAVSYNTPAAGGLDGTVLEGQRGEPRGGQRGTPNAGQKDRGGRGAPADGARAGGA